MARTGPKAKLEVVKDQIGTARPDRERKSASLPVEGEPVRPKWLKGEAKRQWDERISAYRARGILSAIVGREQGLAQYCATGAALVDNWKRGLVPPVALINAYRIWCNEFGDTPASDMISGAKKPANKFANNGRKPE